VSRHILTAPEVRTRQTAGALGLDATEESELRDCDFGRWLGRSLETVEMDELSVWLTDIAAAPHGGESFHDLMTRVGYWLERQRDSGTVVAITHASIIRAAVVHALHSSPRGAYLRIEVGPLTISEIRLTGGSWRLRSVGVPLTGVTLE
jgi:broad specificity phosphatase PhoE